MTAATLGLTVLAGCGGQQNKTQAEASKATGSQTTEAESSGVTSDVDLVDESAPTDNTAAALVMVYILQNLIQTAACSM